MGDIYKDKYLKYKAKYLALKNNGINIQQGGAIFQYPFEFVDPSLNSNTDCNTAQLYFNIKLKKDSTVVQGLQKIATDLGYGQNLPDDYHLTLLIVRLAYGSDLFNAFDTIYFRNPDITLTEFYDTDAKLIFPAEAKWKEYVPGVDLDTKMKDIFNTALHAIFNFCFKNKILNTKEDNYDCLFNDNFAKIYQNDDFPAFFTNYECFQDHLLLCLKYLLKNFTEEQFDIHVEPPKFSIDSVSKIHGAPDPSMNFLHHCLASHPPKIPKIYDPSNSLFCWSHFYNSYDISGLPIWVPHLTLIKKSIEVCGTPKNKVDLISKFILRDRQLSRDYPNFHRINQINLWNNIYRDVTYVKFTISEVLELLSRFGYLHLNEFVQTDRSNPRSHYEIPLEKYKNLFDPDGSILPTKYTDMVSQDKHDGDGLYIQRCRTIPVIHDGDDGDVEAIEFTLYIGGHTNEQPPGPNKIINIIPIPEEHL